MVFIIHLALFCEIWDGSWYNWTLQRCSYREAGGGGSSGPTEFGTTEFGRSVNPIQTSGRGADYARHITASPPGLKILSTPLLYYIHMHILFRPWILQGLLYKWTENSILPMFTWGRKNSHANFKLYNLSWKLFYINLLFCLMIWLLGLKIMFFVFCNNWMFEIIRPYLRNKIRLFRPSI